MYIANNKFYLYYAAVRDAPLKRQNLAAIGVATSSTMDIGSRKDLGGIGIQSSGNSKYNAIDPNLFEENGNMYMLFGSHRMGLFQA